MDELITDYTTFGIYVARALLGLCYETGELYFVLSNRKRGSKQLRVN